MTRSKGTYTCFDNTALEYILSQADAKTGILILLEGMKNLGRGLSLKELQAALPHDPKQVYKAAVSLLEDKVISRTDDLFMSIAGAKTHQKGAKTHLPWCKNAPLTVQKRTKRGAKMHHQEAEKPVQDTVSEGGKEVKEVKKEEKKEESVIPTRVIGANVGEVEAPPNLEGYKDPIQERKNFWRKGLEAQEDVYGRIGTELTVKLKTIQQQVKYRDDTWQNWLRELVAPQLERLGANANNAVEEAVKAFYGASNPVRYGLKDFVSALRNYAPQGPSRTENLPAAASLSDRLDAIYAELLGDPLEAPHVA